MQLIVDCKEDTKRNTFVKISVLKNKRENFSGISEETTLEFLINELDFIVYQGLIV